jgi:integrase
MTEGEFVRLLAAIPSELRLPTELLRYGLLDYESVLKATWEQYDEARRALHYTSVRDRQPLSVVFPDDIHERLLRLRAAEQDRGRGADDNYIFTRVGRGLPFYGNERFRFAVFGRGFKQAGLDYDRRVHRLRHTYASAQAVMGGRRDKGAEIKALQRNLGHSDFTTTYNMYVHLWEDQEAEPADASAFLDALRDGTLINRRQPADGDDNEEGGR